MLHACLKKGVCIKTEKAVFSPPNVFLTFFYNTQKTMGNASQSKRLVPFFDIFQLNPIKLKIKTKRIFYMKGMAAFCFIMHLNGTSKCKNML